MADIFLSYATTDRGRVQPIAEVFVSLGYTVFWDIQVKPGERWDTAIDAELKNARCVVVIWSQQSIRSTWVLAEAHQAVKRTALIPILIDDVVRDIPLPFHLLQAANLAGVTELQLPSHPAFLQVLRRIQELLGPAPARNRASQEESRGTKHWQVRSGSEPHPEHSQANQRDTTVESIQVKRAPPRRSAPGCVAAALLLTVGAIGLTVSRDTRANSPLPSLLAPVTSAPGMHTSSEGISGLRRLHSVRALQDSENGKTLSQIPAGTFGYIEPLTPEHLPQARVRNTPALGPVEVHKLTDGSLMLVGFARDSEVRSLSQGGRSRLTLFRAASTQAKAAIAIPTAWIRSVFLTAQGEIMLDLSSSSR